MNKCVFSNLDLTFKEGLTFFPITFENLHNYMELKITNL